MKIKRILILFLFFIIIIYGRSYGKYYYVFENDIADLTRDISELNCVVTYSQTELTNQDVTIYINSNTELEQVSGFVLSDDKKMLTKTVTENESGTIKVYDLSGNMEEVSYSVNNIDKEKPKIENCKNNETYQSPLNLEYTDNSGIKDVYVDKYDDELEVQYFYFYHNSKHYIGIDRTKSTIRVTITSHPLNTRKYLLYLDGKLYATTTENVFEYTGLDKGKTYNIKVVAVNQYGTHLDEKSFDATTSYFEKITSTKTSSKFTCKFYGLDSNIKYVKFALWNSSDEDNQYFYDVNTNNGTVSFSFNKFENIDNPTYTIHAFLYDYNGNYLDIVGFAISFRYLTYTPPDFDIDPYCLTQSGNYQIIVTDIAGNQVIYYIKIE